MPGASDSKPGASGSMPGASGNIFVLGTSGSMPLSIIDRTTSSITSSASSPELMPALVWLEAALLQPFPIAGLLFVLLFWRLVDSFNWKTYNIRL